VLNKLITHLFLHNDDDDDDYNERRQYRQIPLPSLPNWSNVFSRYVTVMTGLYSDVVYKFLIAWNTYSCLVVFHLLFGWYMMNCIVMYIELFF